eukprot:2837830-Rhodomonas_salina.1
MSWHCCFAGMPATDPCVSARRAFVSLTRNTDPRSFRPNSDQTSDPTLIRSDPTLQRPLQPNPTPNPQPFSPRNPIRKPATRLRQPSPTHTEAKRAEKVVVALHVLHALALQLEVGEHVLGRPPPQAVVHMEHAPSCLRCSVLRRAVGASSAL